jgi:hypothetical protein
MQVPDRLKVRNRWVAAVVQRLSPPSARIPVEPLGIAPGSTWHAFALRAREVFMRLPAHVRGITRSLLSRSVGAPAIHSGIGSVMAEYVRTFLENGHPIWDRMERERAVHLLGEGNEAQLAPLGTILVLARQQFAMHGVSVQAARGGVARGMGNQ